MAGDTLVGDYFDKLREPASEAESELTEQERLDKIESLKTTYGDYVTDEWLTSHGLTAYSTPEEIQSVIDEEMIQLDEDWAVEQRKTMKQGKSSLLSGGTTGLGLEDTQTNSLLQ
jgi:hypothetical protein